MLSDDEFSDSDTDINREDSSQTDNDDNGKRSGSDSENIEESDHTDSEEESDGDNFEKEEMEETRKEGVIGHVVKMRGLPNSVKMVGYDRQKCLLKKGGPTL